jgi:hypothetical protein
MLVRADQVNAAPIPRCNKAVGIFKAAFTPAADLNYGNGIRQ